MVVRIWLRMLHASMKLQPVTDMLFHALLSCCYYTKNANSAEPFRLLRLSTGLVVGFYLSTAPTPCNSHIAP